MPDHFGRKAPWSVAELNRLLGVVARLPEEFAHKPAAIDGLPARRWWTAFLLTLLDTGLGIGEPLSVAPEAFQGNRLACGRFIYELQPATIEAIDQLRACPADAPAGGPPQLFPWRLDRGGIKHMLLRAYKSILFRAGLPHAAADLFDRLRKTSAAGDVLFALLDPDLDFRPSEEKLLFERARGRQLIVLRETVPAPPRGRGRGADPAPHVFTLETNSRRPLRALFDYYRKHRYGERSRDAQCATLIKQLEMFAGHTVDVAELNDDLAESFAAWRLAAGLTPATVKGDLAVLLALWRFAYKKRLTEIEPRDVTAPRVPKKIPEAWGERELVAILRSCAEETGRVGPLQAREFWPLFVLLFYDTGLRLEALLNLRTAAIDLASGCLTVPHELQKQKADQVFWLHPQTLAMVRATRAEDREQLLLVPSKDPARWLRKRYRVILKRAGLKHGPRDLFHKLRRTSATFVADNCGDEAARQHLGHSSIALTRNSYIDPRKLTRSLRVAELIPRPQWRPGEGEPL